MVWSVQSPALAILAAFLLCSVAFAQTDLARPFEPDAQTVELYHLDDLAGGACADVMGGPAGTLQGVMPTLGRFGGGASLTGEQAWVDITRKAPPAPQKGLTVECWAKFPSRAQGDLICRNSAYMMRLSGGLQAYIGIDGSWRKVVGSRPVPIGRWVHLAMTYDQATREVRVYIDGRLDVAGKPEGLTEGKLNAGSEVLRLGTNTWNPAGGMVEACLDELRVSSVARTFAPLPGPGVEVPAPGTNLVTNPSFEFGRYGWRPEYESDGRLQWTVVSSDAVAGRCFLRSMEPGNCGLMSYPIALAPGRSYTLSVALRADKPADVRLAINATGLAPDARRPGRNQNVNVTTEWQRFSLKYAIPQDYPADRVYVSFGKPRDVQLDVDAVSLVAGDASDFVASDASDLGLALDLPQGNTLDLAGPGRLPAQLVNGSKVARTMTLDSRVVDWLGEEVAAEKLFEGELPPLSARPMTVTVPTTRVGWFTLEVRTSADGKQVSRLPYVVNVVAPMDHRGDAFTSPLGMNTHMERESGAHLQHNLGTLARYGVKWIRAWWGWGMAEKQPGQFDWTEYDRQFKEVNATGMEIMPILLRYYPNFEQSWAGKTEEIQQPPYDLKQWGDYVQATVSRYQGRVKAWEVWNEPSYTM
ncbi:carbohydrate binding domain-containing protein, partial [bacterium]|nr:carbohydrate binding domain-containing protein [bacterium]